MTSEGERMPDKDSLVRHLAWLEISDCPCQYAWKQLGALYRVSLGKGWVRMTTDPTCPHHGDRNPKAN